MIPTIKQENTSPTIPSIKDAMPKPLCFMMKTSPYETV